MFVLVLILLLNYGFGWWIAWYLLGIYQNGDWCHTAGDRGHLITARCLTLFGVCGFVPSVIWVQTYKFRNMEVKCEVYNLFSYLKSKISRLKYLFWSEK